MLEGLCQTPRLSFGPILGNYIPSVAGSATAGDVQVTTTPDAGDSERMIGLGISYRVNKYLSVSSQINYTQQFASFTVWNAAEQCQFCPVRKQGGFGINIIEFYPNADLNLIHLGKLALSVNGGVSFHFRYDYQPGAQPPPVSFGSKHPGVAEVINQLWDGYKSNQLFLTYGFGIRYSRVFALVRWLDMTGPSMMNNLSLNGNSYPHIVNSNFVLISVGYHFYGFRRKNSNRS